MSDFRYPTPTASPFLDIEQYIPLLLTAVGAELDNQVVWPDGEGAEGEGYTEDLYAWIMEIKNNMTVPVGGIVPYAGSSAPAGWLICDGSVLSTATYSALYALIGTVYGADGGGTFKLPDLRGKGPIGAGQGESLTNRVLASTFGTETHTLITAETPSHNHTQAAHNHGVTDSGHSHSVNNPTHSHGVTDSGHSHTVNNPAHSHGVTDGGHSHSVNNPAHSHGVTDGGHSHGVTDPGHAHKVGGRNAGADGTGTNRLANSSAVTTLNVSDTSVTLISVNAAGTGVSVNSAATAVSVNAAGTGVSVNSAATAVSVNAAGTGVSVNSAATAVSVNSGTTGVSVQNATPTINNTGGGGAHNNMPPVLVLNFIIRAL